MPGQTTVRRESQKATTGFDYSQFAGSIETPVKEEVRTIRRLLEKSAANAVQIGLRLQFVRNRIGRLHFQQWLKAEFCWSQSVASKYMCVARVFEDVDHLEGFQASALYILAKRKVCPAARQEALRLASQGEFISKERAQQIVVNSQSCVPARVHVRIEQVRKQVERALRRLPEDQAARILDELTQVMRRSGLADSMDA